MPNFKLSIITICYNEKNLEKTCESIVNQVWQDFEWIVIDGGSNSDILKIFDKYKYRINKFISETDNGIYDACNKGIKLAEGEYLNFMNAGDAYCDNNVLQKVFSEDYTGDILYGDEYYVYPDKPKELMKMPEILDAEQLVISTIRHQSSFIKRELFEKYGLYSENYKIVSDWEKWILFFKNNVKFTHIPFAIADYDTSGCSFSLQYERLQQKERKNVLNKYFSKQEIKNILKERKERNREKYSLSEQILSIRNDKNNRHKIITILGIHLKIKI